MKTVHIVGIGMNGPTGRAAEIVACSDVLLGAPRQLDVFAHLGKPSYAEYKPEAVREIIERSDASTFAVLVSGDVGFFSGARSLTDALVEYDIRLAAGVPSVCDFCAKLKIPWQDAALISAHRTRAPLVSTVRRNRLTFCLTGGNTREIGETLSLAGFGELTVHVGENLGYPDERIYSVGASELGETRPMTVLLIVNPDYNASVPFGLPDTAFERLDGVPMTKSEVRAVVMSKLRLSPGSVCYDVGAGTGSLTVEMALSAYNGHVYAVERSADALTLAQSNCRRFNIGNVSFVSGHAPDALNELPAPGAVFIGGAGGKMGAIVDAVLLKNPNARLVVTAIALESAYSALSAYESAGLSDIELVHLNVSRAEKKGGLHMLYAQNPIFIVSGGGA